MFLNFVEDSPELFHQMLQKDYEYSKIGRLRQSDRTRPALHANLQRFYGELKNIFLYLVANSGQTEQALGIEELTQFAHKCKILDGKLTIAKLREEIWKSSVSW